MLRRYDHNTGDTNTEIDFPDPEGVTFLEVVVETPLSGLTP